MPLLWPKPENSMLVMTEGNAFLKPMFSRLILLRRRWLLTLLTTSTLAPTSYCQESLNISWQNAFSVFQQQYRDAAPQAFAQEQAELQATAEAPNRFNPTLTATQNSVTSSSTNRSNLNRSLALNQGSSFGTGFRIFRDDIRYDTKPSDSGTASGLESSTVTGVTISQELLRDGPWFAHARNKLPETIAIAARTAANDNEQRLFEAFLDAFITAQSAQFSLEAATRARAEAQQQHQSVSGLVASGFKAKADKLVTQGALVQSNIAYEASYLEAKSARRRLAKSLFVAEALSLKITPEPPSDDLIARLTKLPWPDNIPDLTLAELKQEQAALESSLTAASDLPKLTIAASRSQIHSQYTDIPTVADASEDSSRTTITLSIDLPLVSSFSREQSQISHLKLRQSQRELSQTKRELAQLRQDLNDQKELAKQRVIAAKELLNLAQQSLNIEKQKYADGETTISELARFQLSFDNAQLALINAKAQQLRGLIHYARITGQLIKEFT